MSALFNQTNISPGTTNFITRAEVIEGLSSIAGFASTINFSSIFNNPNPVVSTLTVNPSGTISYPGLVQTQDIQFSTISKIQPISGFGTNYNAIGVTNTQNTSYNGLYGAAFIAQAGNPTTNSDKMLYGVNNVYAIPQATGVPNYLMRWLPGNPTNQQFVLDNVSSINGVNPTQSGTTFTSLTGQNITLTGNLLAPQITGLSSINGVSYQVPYNGTYNFSQSITAPTGNATLVYSIPLPASYLQPNTTYIYDVPLVLTSQAPGSPTSFVCNIGLRLGNNGQINYQIPLTIFTTTQGFTVNLTGIAQTNSTTIGSQTIDLVIVQNSGSPFTATWAAPTSGGGLNTYTIKPLS